MMQVRLRIGDTISSDPMIQDEEITYLLTVRPSIWGACADCCRSIAGRLSREADTVDKDLRTTLSTRARSFLRMASEYETKAIARGGALPYAGGLSFADKAQNELNTDRVQPQFSIDMDDNYEPVAPVGNEGTPLPSGQAEDDEGD